MSPRRNLIPARDLGPSLMASGMGTFGLAAGLLAARLWPGWVAATPPAMLLLGMGLPAVIVTVAGMHLHNKAARPPGRQG